MTTTKGYFAYYTKDEIDEYFADDDILYEEYLRIQRKKIWVNGYTGIVEVKQFPNNPIGYADFFNYRNQFE